MIDQKIQVAGGSLLNEVRRLLFAALLLADELHEAGQGRGSATSLDSGHDPDQYAAALDALATRLESCADALEG